MEQASKTKWHDRCGGIAGLAVFVSLALSISVQLWDRLSGDPVAVWVSETKALDRSVATYTFTVANLGWLNRCNVVAEISSNIPVVWVDTLPRELDAQEVYAILDLCTDWQIADNTRTKVSVTIERLNDGTINHGTCVMFGIMLISSRPGALPAGKEKACHAVVSCNSRKTFSSEYENNEVGLMAVLRDRERTLFFILVLSCVAIVGACLAIGRLRAKWSSREQEHTEQIRKTKDSAIVLYIVENLTSTAEEGPVSDILKAIKKLDESP